MYQGRDEIESLIRKSRLKKHAEELIAALRPQIDLNLAPWIGSTLPLGESRLGGPADLPAGVEYPHHESRPMLLLAQLNFAMLIGKYDRPPGLSLPTDGWLCLFCDADNHFESITGDSPAVAAIHFDGKAQDLVRHDPTPVPAKDAEIWTVCHRARVTRSGVNFVLPDAGCPDAPPSFRDDESDGSSKYDELVEEIRYAQRTDSNGAFLLGSPTLYNPDPRPDDDWTLLFHIKGEAPCFAGVGDGGKYPRDPKLGSLDFLGVYIQNDDLAAGRFDRLAFCGMLS